MRRTRLASPLALSALSLLTAPVLTGCGVDGSPDRTAFCERLDRLTANDPFQAFGDRATPAEIRTAFAALTARADELVDVAPDQVRGPAEDYADAADALDELLAAAAYDGDLVDARAYREEQVAYTEAAATLQRYLEADC